MRLKLCPKCRRPYMADKEFCPSCPEPYAWNPESYANMGCMLAMMAPILFFVLFWLFLLFGMMMR